MRDGTISLGGSTMLNYDVGYLGSEVIRVVQGSISGRKRRQASIETLTAIVDITTANNTMTTAAVDNVLNGATFTNIFVMPSPNSIIGYCRKLSLW
jgi:hypothetical protein